MYIYDNISLNSYYDNHFLAELFQIVTCYATIPSFTLHIILAVQHVMK